MADPAPTIREALREDLQAVAALCAQWQAEGITRGYCADRAEELAGRLGPCFLVAESGGERVGFVIGEIKPSAGDQSVEGVLDDQPTYLEVQDLYVTPPHRRKGIGTGLMRALFEWAAKLGAGNSLVYSANRDYVRTARFYENLGYDMWHIRMTRRT